MTDIQKTEIGKQSLAEPRIETGPRAAVCRNSGANLSCFRPQRPRLKNKQTCTTIWEQYFPRSEYKPAKGIEFELYDENFDSKTGLGGLELWIPIQNRKRNEHHI